MMERALSGKGLWCLVPNCYNKRQCTKIVFFSLPKEKSRCDSWLINCGRKDLLNKKLGRGYVMCAHHFEDNCFMDPLHKKLKPNAMPTIFPTIPTGSLALPILSLSEEKVTEHISIENEQTSFVSLENKNLKSELDTTHEKEHDIKIYDRLMVNNKLKKYVRWSKEHLNKRRFKCDICNKIFKHNSAMQNHRMIHTGEKPYKCNICFKRFRLKVSLCTHKMIHTGEKPYKCDICHKKFVLCRSLWRHKQIHSGKKPFQCNICHKEFAFNGYLLQHKTIHTGEKSFLCEECGKIFSRMSNLNLHRKRVHTEEKSYECDICQKRFRLNAELQKHKKTHTGEKSFECNKCLQRNHLKTFYLVYTQFQSETT